MERDLWRCLCALFALTLGLGVLAGCNDPYFDVRSCSLDGGPWVYPCGEVMTADEVIDGVLVPAGSYSVQYDDLAPGQHTFQVRVQRFLIDDDGEGHHPHPDGPSVDTYPWVHEGGDARFTFAIIEHPPPADFTG